MHPAFSVIFFTVVSGCGYGLLFLLAFGIALDPHIVERTDALCLLTIGCIFAAAGLTSSLFHLGKPQRAWRALSQWRSSWLSREGVASLITFIPLFSLGIAIYCNTHDVIVRTLAAVLAVMSIVTVCCTAKIYNSLKTVHAWHNGHVLPTYLLFALLGGSVWLLAISAALNSGLSYSIRISLALVILVSCVIGTFWKRIYWHFIDTTRHPATTETATGLGQFGSVQSVEAPHTEENYLTREMGYSLARKHSVKLRAICLILIGVFPAVLALIVLIIGMQFPVFGIVCGFVLAICVTAGLFVERWLFFAEARHVVMLFYRQNAL
jgi:sulfite dehydrogenase (quinone) subunit SoeC